MPVVETFSARVLLDQISEGRRS